jgi:hypothetical protein
MKIAPVIILINSQKLKTKWETAYSLVNMPLYPAKIYIIEYQ